MYVLLKCAQQHCSMILSVIWNFWVGDTTIVSVFIVLHWLHKPKKRTRCIQLVPYLWSLPFQEIFGLFEAESTNSQDRNHQCFHHKICCGMVVHSKAW